MQYTRVEISLDYTYTIIHFNEAQQLYIVTVTYISILSIPLI